MRRLLPIAVALAGCSSSPRVTAVDAAGTPDLITVYDFQTKHPSDFAGAVDSSTVRDLGGGDFATGDDLPMGDLAMADVAMGDDLPAPADMGPQPDLAPIADLEINYCIIQFPASTTTKANVPTVSIYGQVYQAGLTDVNMNGPAPGIGAQLGYGQAGSDPRNGSWSWVNAQPNLAFDWTKNNDEYQASLTVAAPGSYSYAYRFTVTQGAGFTYCDTVGNGNNMNLPAFDPQKTGALTVTN